MSKKLSPHPMAPEEALKKLLNAKPLKEQQEKKAASKQRQQSTEKQSEEQGSKRAE